IIPNFKSGDSKENAVSSTPVVSKNKTAIKRTLSSSKSTPKVSRLKVSTDQSKLEASPVKPHLPILQPLDLNLDESFLIPSTSTPIAHDSSIEKSVAKSSRLL